MRNKMSFTILTGVLLLSLLGAGCNQEVDTKSSAEEENSPTDNIQMENTSEPEDSSVSTAPEAMIEPMNTSRSEDGAENREADTLINNEIELDAPLQKNQDSEQEPELKVFNIEAKQWEFLPAVITVNQGDRVQLNVTSTDVRHGIAVVSFGVSANLEPGKTATLDFIADKKGTFSMVCTVFCGSGHGSMKGSLIVK